MFAIGVLKHSLKIVFTVAGFEKIHDFKKIHNTLIERDEVTNTEKIPEQPLDDVRWLIKVLQKSRDINICLIQTRCKDSLESLRTILNKFSHGVRSSFGLFTDSLDEYDAPIENSILNAVFKESKYTQQDVVLLASSVSFNNFTN